jgi:hypothetical protein
MLTLFVAAKLLWDIAGNPKLKLVFPSFIGCCVWFITILLYEIKLQCPFYNPSVVAPTFKISIM